MPYRFGNCSDDIQTSYDDELTAEDEVQRILKEVKIAIEHVKKSNFFAKLTEQINSNEFQSQLKKVMGESNSQVNIVIHALGSLEFGFSQNFQLGIALLMKQDFSSWMREKIEVYDPVLSPADVIVLKELGCEVLLINERCRRQGEKPTLFYMPYAQHNRVGDLLGANCCASRNNQLILLKTSFKHSYRQMGKISKAIWGKFSNAIFSGTPEDYTDAIQDHTKEILIEEGWGSLDNIFYNFAFHFFEIRLENFQNAVIEPFDFLRMHKDSEKIFTSPFAKDALRQDWADTYKTYRCPREYQCSWNPPPEGWIKLNFGGTSSNNGKNLAGFGGICHDESNEPILIYNGALDKVDKTMASIEALRFGLTEVLKIPSVTRNLIVVGDDLMVIQRANERQIERPQEIHEVLSLLKEFNSLVYYIYEEANLAANNLAKKKSYIFKPSCLFVRPIF
ncbi:hypothetical protein ACH5RR_022681 [Cinchona calisaya]|uniref:RNase H type-1 domain-containing protein n=1 Tax=Cinchona calisaya TaxID=153742 RepID=A0ABD2Z9L0_9GENT